MLTYPQKLMNKKQHNQQNKSQETVLITYLPSLTTSKCNTFMFLFCLFCIFTSAIATSNHDNGNQFNLLTSFAYQHARQYSLIQVNTQNKQKLNDSTLIYFYNSVEYAQICYQKNQNISLLPLHLIYRSYSPIQPASSEISCYQLQKQSLVETPSVEVPRVDLSDADQNKKYKKQTQYLINEYNLVKWAYNFGVSIEKQLGNIKQNSNSKSMSLHHLDVFSTLLNCNEDGTISLQKIWKRNDTLTSDSFKVYKKLAGKGLHQEVTYTINIENNDKKIPKVTYDINGEECYVSILQTLPHTIYVDVDELKSRGFQVDLENGQFGDGVGYINIQKPAYQSRQYQYKLKIPWNTWNNTHGNQYQLKTPIHFRYPTPYFLQKLQQGKKKEIEYVQVDLQSTTKAEIICREQSDKDVYQLKEDHLVARGSAFVPVGDGEMKSAVNIVTLGSSIMCAVFLVRKLRK